MPPSISAVNSVPSFFHVLQNSRHALDVVKDHHVCHEMVVLDDLALLVSQVLGDDSIATKKDHLANALNCSLLFVSA